MKFLKNNSFPKIFNFLSVLLRISAWICFRMRRIHAKSVIVLCEIVITLERCSTSVLASSAGLLFSCLLPCSSACVDSRLLELSLISHVLCTVWSVHVLQSSYTVLLYTYMHCTQSFSASHLLRMFYVCVLCRRESSDTHRAARWRSVADTASNLARRGFARRLVQGALHELD